MEKTLYCFIGESGSGKNAVVEALKNEYGIREVLSHTARPRRYPGETGYIFSDEVTYEKHKAEGLVFEETEIEGANGVKYHYWTNKDEYEYEGVKVLICDPEGYNHLEKLTDTNVIGIHIKADAITRMNRLIASSKKLTEREKIDEANMRMARSKEKFKLIYCDAVIDNNGSLEDTMKRVKQVMNIE